jgi:broad specificity phosphatase PhoE
MPRLYLVRHARPAASWGEDPDPGLDALGQAQALAAAQQLAERLTYAPIYSSPLKRCRETAAPLAELWHSGTQISQAVAEIPSPPLDLGARREWLTRAMAGTWAELNAAAPSGSPDYLAWRAELVASLLAMPQDCVLYTHFIAINVAVGAANDTQQVVTFRPDHASITVVDASAGRIRVVALGREAETSVLLGKNG